MKGKFWIGAILVCVLALGSCGAKANDFAVGGDGAETGAPTGEDVGPDAAESEGGQGGKIHVSRKGYRVGTDETNDHNLLLLRRAEPPSNNVTDLTEILQHTGGESSNISGGQSVNSIKKQKGFTNVLTDVKKRRIVLVFRKQY